MTRIPIEPLPLSAAGESFVPSGDSRDPALDEDSRFDAHLRRAEKKSDPAPENRPSAESENHPKAESAEEGGPAEAEPAAKGEDASDPSQKEQRDTASQGDSEERPSSESEQGAAAASNACVDAAYIVETVVSSGQTAGPAGEIAQASGTAEAQITPSSQQSGTGDGGGQGFDTTPLPPSETAADSNAVASEHTTTPASEEAVAEEAALKTTAVDAMAETQSSLAATTTSQGDSAVAQTAMADGNRRVQGDEATLQDEAVAPEALTAESSSTVISQTGETAGEGIDSSTDSESQAPAEDVSSSEEATTTEGDLADLDGPRADAALGAKENTTSTESTTETSLATPEPTGAASAAQVSGPAQNGPADSLSAVSEPPPEGQADGPDPSRFIRRVAGAFDAAARRGGPIRVQLTPPELGTLRLEIKVERGEIVARLETDTQEARNVLLDNLPALRQRLEQQDIKVQRFDVEYDAGSDGSGPAPEDRQGNHEEGRRNPSPRTPRAAEVEESIRSHPTAEVASDGRLNLFA